MELFDAFLTTTSLVVGYLSFLYLCNDLKKKFDTGRPAEEAVHHADRHGGEAAGDGPRPAAYGAALPAQAAGRSAEGISNFIYDSRLQLFLERSRQVRSNFFSPDNPVA